MKAHCYACQAETLVTTSGTCSWCDDKITNKPARARYGIGAHSYIGTEEFYATAYKRYQELQSIRAVASKVWKQAGYKTQASCANSLHEAWVARGWPLFSRSYSNTTHGKTRQGHIDQAHRHALRVKRGEIRGVKCAGVRKNAPRKGKPCSLYAVAGSAYCVQHKPARDAQRHAHLARMRAAQETTR